MGTRSVHRLTIVDRGAGHIHRWTATCACGWIAQHRSTQDDAAGLHRDHAALEQRVARRTRRRARPALAPAPLTPPDQLPEELR